MSQELEPTPQLIANQPESIDVLVNLYWQSRLGNSGHGAPLKRHLARSRIRPSIGAVGSMSKTEAKRKLRQFLEQIGLNSLCYVIPPEMSARTFGEVSDQWEERVLNGKKRSTRRTMKSELRKHLRPAFGKLSMDCITAQKVTDYAAERHSSGLSVKSVRNLVITLNMIRKYPGMPIFLSSP